MAPRIDRNQPNTPLNRNDRQPDNPARTANNQTTAGNVGAAGRRAAFAALGSQQKDRIERLYGAGAAGLSTIRDIRLGAATKQANIAFAREYQAQLKALGNPGASGAPQNLIEVSQRAETAYRNALSAEGFTPADVRGTSVVKTADFLRSEASRPGDFTTLSPSQIDARVAAGDPPQYFVRIMDKGYLSKPTAQLSNPNSPHLWMATPEEIAGAKLDGFETMKRVGFSDSYIAGLQAKGKTPSDFVLVLTEARGVGGQKPPTWDNVLDAARNHQDFARFQRTFNNPNFVSQVQSPDYKARFEDMNARGLTDVQYARTLPKAERGAFLFRNEMNRVLGVNEFFTGNGRTERTDGRNQGVGVREILGRNDQVASMQRNTYVELSETGKTDLRAVDNVPTISDNPLRLRSEMRTGALAGGGVSAATTLYQIFNQPGPVDYGNAAQTLVSNTALGTTVGALSAGGERVVGRGIENFLERSAGAQRGIDRLFTNGAARNVASRLAGNQTAGITSQTFNSTVRTVAGRIGGAGVVGGVVNGAFSAYDQIGAYKRGEVTGSQAVGTVVGETSVGIGAGLSGAAAGAAIGSIIPGAGTIVGGVIGFGVGLAAGYFADKGLRGLGVDKAIASGVTATIDAGARAVGQVQEFGREAANAVGNTVDSARNAVGNVANNVGNAVSGGLKSMFGW